MPLQHILMNLIGNGIKHHHRKTGNIEVTVEDAGDFYAFAVKDDGPGIARAVSRSDFRNVPDAAAQRSSGRQRHGTGDGAQEYRGFRRNAAA